METIKKFDDCYCDTFLKKDPGGCNILECIIDNHTYGFNVGWVAEDKMNWLARMYSGSLIKRGRDARNDLRTEINSKQKEIDYLLIGE